MACVRLVGQTSKHSTVPVLLGILVKPVRYIIHCFLQLHNVCIMCIYSYKAGKLLTKSICIINYRLTIERRGLKEGFYGKKCHLSFASCHWTGAVVKLFSEAILTVLRYHIWHYTKTNNLDCLQLYFILDNFK